MTTSVLNPQLLTVEEAAAKLRVSERTVRRLVATGRLRVVQPGGPGHALRVPADELFRDVSGEPFPAHGPTERGDLSSARAVDSPAPAGPERRTRD